MDYKKIEDLNARFHYKSSISTEPRISIQIFSKYSVKLPSQTVENSSEIVSLTTVFKIFVSRYFSKLHLRFLQFPDLSRRLTTSTNFNFWPWDSSTNLKQLFIGKRLEFDEKYEKSRVSIPRVLSIPFRLFFAPCDDLFESSNHLLV